MSGPGVPHRRCWNSRARIASARLQTIWPGGQPSCVATRRLSPVRHSRKEQIGSAVVGRVDLAGRISESKTSDLVVRRRPMKESNAPRRHVTTAPKSPTGPVKKPLSSSQSHDGSSPRSCMSRSGTPIRAASSVVDCAAGSPHRSSAQAWFSPRRSPATVLWRRSSSSWSRRDIG